MREKISPRNIAPEAAVHRGERKVSTVASESERYCSEKYTPISPKNLRLDSLWEIPIVHLDHIP